MQDNDPVPDASLGVVALLLLVHVARLRQISFSSNQSDAAPRLHLLGVAPP